MFPTTKVWIRAKLKKSAMLPLENFMTFKKPMLPALLCAAMILAACSTTRQIEALPSPSSPVKAVPCVEVPAIPYHAPQNATELTALLDGTLPDPKNVYDTPSTITAIRRANAAINAVCQPGG